MNAKEVKEYLDSLPKPSVITVDSSKYKSAICHGYLEALAGEEVRILVEALEDLMFDDSEPKQYRSHVVAKEALAKFKSVTGEK